MYICSRFFVADQAAADVDFRYNIMTVPLLFFVVWAIDTKKIVGHSISYSIFVILFDSILFDILLEIICNFSWIEPRGHRLINYSFYSVIVTNFSIKPNLTCKKKEKYYCRETFFFYFPTYRPHIGFFLIKNNGHYYFD